LRLTSTLIPAASVIVRQDRNQVLKTCRGYACTGL